jgi:hypothetical protein
MKYFISEKEESHFAHTKVKPSEAEKFDFSNAEEIVVYPGVIEEKIDPKGFVKNIIKTANSGCRLEFGFINIYQLFVDAAFHRLDVGVAHKVCAGIQKPYNVAAAKHTLMECGLKIKKVYFEEELKIIKVECENA